MVNFGPPETVPDKFRSRQFYQHNPTGTLMRTTVEENAELGREIGRKVAASTGLAALLVPLRGVSAIDCEGQPFDDPQARQALLAGIRQQHGAIELQELDCHINDPEFAEAAARKLIQFMQK